MLNIQDKTDVKHKDVKMNWLRKFFPKYNLAEEFVQVNKYGAINVDNPNADNFYVVKSTSMPYTLQ
eukprot:1953569-Ditylum_brightwellii.AAC.1